MSITVRLWTDTDLLNLASDDNLLTTFFNVKTYSQKELSRLYELTEKRKTYFVYFNSFSDDNWNGDEYEADCRKVYAVNDESLLWFVKQEYVFENVDSIIEVVSTTRDVLFEKSLTV